MSRLAKALRDLAAALDDVEKDGEWELVKEEGEKKKKGGVESGVASEVSAAGGEKAGPSASDIAYRKDWRCYVIVEHPGGLVGFAEGEGADTWRKIENSLPGRRLRGSGARLRRVANWEEAMVIWQKGHPKLPLPRLEF